MSAYQWKTKVISRRKPLHIRPHPWVKIEKERPRHRYQARGRVWRVGDTWYYEVRVGDKIVGSDNTSHWKSIFDACNQTVYAFDRVLGYGHKINKSYAQLVDEAR